MVHLVKENWREYIRKNNLVAAAVEQFVQLTTSYHEEGHKEGRIEGKEEGREENKEIGLEMTLTALEAFREGKNLDEVMSLTGLERDNLLKIQAHAFK